MLRYSTVGRLLFFPAAPSLRLSQRAAFHARAQPTAWLARAGMPSELLMPAASTPFSSFSCTSSSFTQLSSFSLTTPLFPLKSSSSALFSSVLTNRSYSSVARNQREHSENQTSSPSPTEPPAAPLSSSESPVSPSLPSSSTPSSALTWAAIRESTSALMAGSKQLAKDAMFLMRMRFRKEPMTRRELQIVKRGEANLIASVPWLLFFLLPFIGYAVPIIAILRPRLLPEPFWSDAQRQRFWAENARQRSHLSALFLRQHADLVAAASSATATAPSSLSAWPEAVLSEARTALLLRRPTPRWLGGPSSLESYLSEKIEELMTDDHLLREEGLENLDQLEPLELQSACYHRSVQPYSVEVLKQWLLITAHLDVDKHELAYLCELLVEAGKRSNNRTM